LFLTDDCQYGTSARRQRVRHLFVRNQTYEPGMPTSKWDPSQEAVADCIWNKWLQHLPAPIATHRPACHCLLPEHLLPTQQQPIGPWLSKHDAKRVLGRTRRVYFYTPYFQGSFTCIPSGYGARAGNGVYIVYGECMPCHPTCRTHACSI
jgi:hypothetical protein